MRTWRWSWPEEWSDHRNGSWNNCRVRSLLHITVSLSFNLATLSGSVPTAGCRGLGLMFSSFSQILSLVRHRHQKYMSDEPFLCFD